MTMNIFALTLESFSHSHYYFLDTKPNIIMDGIFTKIFFTHECFTLNGIYFFLPLFCQSFEITPQKQEYLYFEPTNPKNINIISYCKGIENTILQAYTNYKGGTLKKTAIHSIIKQLNCGKCKVQLKNNNGKTDKGLNSFVLKISGIWETQTEYGVTFKIIEQSGN